MGVHLNTIRKLVDNGEIRSIEMGRAVRINKIDLMRYAGLTPPPQDEAN
jgi:excisionase family DNA binding protein